MKNPERPELAFLARPEFIAGRLLPALPPALRALADRPEVRQIDTEDPEKMTAVYRLADGTRLYAKVYQEEAAGQHCATVLRQLRDHGFADDAPYRVPEPLAYLTQERVLVMTEAQGVNLNDYLGTNSAAQRAGMQEAARWLVRLHTAPIQVGTPAPYWEHFFKLARRTAKAVERRPAWAERVVDLLDRLAPLAQEAADRPLVQTHGQFRDLHLYLAPDGVTAIDFDRSRPADPSADLDEFVHRLRWKTFKHYHDRPDELTGAFLEEYARLAPPGSLRNLSYYAAYRTLYSLIGLLRSRDDDVTWEEEVAFHLDDYEAALAGRFLPRL
ncbi:MAG: hypothetical protein HY689_15915 [Chloroflexi bacterium]|nr:hypothetical protein [Chloroflexota bacterium]